MKFAVHLVIGALMLSFVPACAAGRCSLEMLSGCTNTNELIWNKAFETSLRKFFGNRRADYLYYEGHPLVADQAIEVLGGPPDVPQRIGDLWRFTACRAHSCPEKGAAVLTSDAKLIAVAILHSLCGEPYHNDDCSSHWILSVFIHPTRQSAIVIDNLSKGGRAQVDSEYDPPSLPADQLDKIEVIKL